ncbi:MAG: M48 family metallopeptidase [Odoribacteraceae bacterium]|nr:M48 family metallopeptidase [Odoribacteraceae bacterium]
MKEAFTIPGIGSVKIRRDDRVKRLSLRVAAGRGAWINIPRGVSDREAEKFLLSKREWLAGHLTKLKAREAMTGIVPGVNAEIKSKFHTLKVLATASDKPYYQWEGNEARLYIPGKIARERVAPLVDRVLVEIYRHESRAYLPGRTRELARRHGFAYNRLAFRDNSSNWGSCSGENNISLNVRLMKLPDEIIDYVILHELCHTIEKNHSARFWALMLGVCPGYVKLRGQLKAYSTRG